MSSSGLAGCVRTSEDKKSILYSLGKAELVNLFCLTVRLAIWLAPPA